MRERQARFPAPALRGTRGAGALRPFRAASHSTASVTRCTRVANAIRRFRAGEFRALRSAGTVSKRIDTPYGGFYPLGTPSSALLGIPRRTERLHRSYLCSGPKKGTAVPLPAHRPQSAIPFTATLKPLKLCYTQLRKTSAICRDNAATARKTEADTVPLCELLTK